jgi:hypothetical protein
MTGPAAVLFEMMGPGWMTRALRPGGMTGQQASSLLDTNANGHTWHHPDRQLIDIVLNGSGEMGRMMRQMMGVPESVPRMPAFKGVLGGGEGHPGLHQDLVDGGPAPLAGGRPP